MQNDVPAGSGTGHSDPLIRPENSLSYDTPSTTVTVGQTSQSSGEVPEYLANKRRAKFLSRLRVAAFIVLGLFVLGGTAFTFFRRGNDTSQVQVGAFSDVQVPLSGILSSEQSTDDAQSLKINGRLEVSDSIILTPTARPDNAAAGQLYFDQTTNRLTYFDGQQFLELQPAAPGTTEITNIFGDSVGAGGINLIGSPGSIAMFTGTNTLGSSLLNQSGTTVNIAAAGSGQVNIGSNDSTTNTVTIDSGSGSGIQIGNSASSHTIQIGTGAGVQDVSVGSGSAASSTAIQGGSGGISLATGNNTGITGSITIKSGDSSTTASGNIAIDAGAGIVDGEIISDKTFEGGVDNMGAWFGSSVAQSSAQAHTGANSLQMTTTNSFWGVEQLVLSAAPVTAGHQYFFSAWVRAGSTPRTINATIVWSNTGGQQVTFTPMLDSATGWTQLTATAPAPATATGAFWRFSSSGAAIGETHYFDDLTITDLSSSAAISAISIGAENAKIVTIGNLNQIGATSIFGSSGIKLNSGAAGTTMQGGVLTITGNAASSLSTTTGALTITSAASATWGVGTAVAGVGGNLILKAGNGGDDANNNGGDLMLQGGGPNGTGTGGSVIVRPLTDSTDAFQIQDSAGTPLFTTDSAGMRITIAGTDTDYMTLVLDNAHFGSTQTTPPTISTPTNCGAAPTATMATGSTDSAGAFTITTGSGGTASTCDAAITFHQAYGAAPKSILVVGKTDAASVARQIFVPAATATSFDISFAISAGGANNIPYNFSYWVIE